LEPKKNKQNIKQITAISTNYIEEKKAKHNEKKNMEDANIVLFQKQGKLCKAKFLINRKLAY
jgi:hypothetical protein